MVLTYIEHLFVLVSSVAGYVLISELSSLVVTPIGVVKSVEIYD